MSWIYLTNQTSRSNLQAERQSVPVWTAGSSAPAAELPAGVGHQAFVTTPLGVPLLPGGAGV